MRERHEEYNRGNCTLALGVRACGSVGGQLRIRYERLVSGQLDERIRAGAAASGGELVECRLLKSAVLLERAETEHDTLARVEATNLLWAIEREYANRPKDWRFFGARLVLMQSLALGEEYAKIYSIATNTIPIAPTSGLERSTNVWSALFGPEIPDVISLRDVFRFNAADALLSVDKAADVNALTNGLPSEMTIRLVGIHED